MNAPYTPDVVMGSLGDSIHDFGSVQHNTLQIPAPPSGIAEWPFVGEKVRGSWSQAHADLPAVLQSMQPKLGELSKQALAMVASIGGSVLLFLFSFIIAGIIMAFGQSGTRSITSIFDRIVGIGRGEEFARLSTATIRAVAQGVIGVAFIQSNVVGLVLMIAGVPFAGGLAMVVLVLGSRRFQRSWSLFRSSSASGRAGLRRRVCGHLHRTAVSGWRARQRTETADAGSRRRCAHARDLVGCVGRSGEHRHPGDVRGRDLAGPGLSDLHEMGGCQAGHPEGTGGAPIAG